MAAYAAGGTLKEVGAQFGISIDTVSKAIQRLGGQTRQTHSVDIGAVRKMSRANAGDWRARYEAGEYLRDIAREFGVTEGTVSKAIVWAGGEVRPRGFGSNPERFRGEGNPAWKGGSYLRDGYRIVWVSPDDPYFCMTGSKGYLSEHRLVMARTIGRSLLDSETVHHIDGDRTNNDPSNLQLRSGRHGTGVHLRCGDCGSQNVTAVEL